MARIPEEVIERLKEEVSLRRLVELAGVELRRQGSSSSRAIPRTSASRVIFPQPPKLPAPSRRRLRRRFRARRALSRS